MKQKTSSNTKELSNRKEKQLEELLRHRYAHRGLHQKPAIPENSMAAFRRAVEAGYGIELDLHLTRDGKLAVIHDSSLKRTCGVDQNIEDMTMEEAQSCFLEESRQQIPEFAEVLQLVAGRVPLIVELKAGKTEEGEDTTAALCRTTVSVLDDYAAAFDGKPGTVSALYCVESFSPVAVKWLRRNRPDIIRGQLAANINREKKTLTGMQNFLLKNLLVNHSGKPDFVAYNFDDRHEAALQRYDGPLFFWTIRNYRDLKEAEDLGAAGIFEQFDPKEYE